MKMLQVVIIVVALVSFGVNVYLLMSRPHIAYVRSYDLIEKYTGTREARSKFEQKRNAMMANVDSMKSIFERERIDYLKNAREMSAAQRNTREQLLGKQQSQIMQYSSAIEEQIEQEDQNLMAPVLSQINTCVEEYAKENGFDLILGTTLSGSLLYGATSIDITDEILENLNTKYKGK